MQTNFFGKSKGFIFFAPMLITGTIVAQQNCTSTGLLEGAYTTSSLTVNVSSRFTAIPNWTLDAQNGSIAAGFFTNAGIPAACDALSHWGFQGSLCSNTGECLSTRKNILRNINF